MITSDKSFHRSTPTQWNDGTLPDAERPAERKSLKAIAGAVLQRNATRNDSGTTGNGKTESFHCSTVWEWNDGTVWGPYTPYCLPSSNWLAMIRELDSLIERYCIKSRTDGSTYPPALAAILAVRHRQSLHSIPHALEWFRREVDADE